ncbi:peptidoglycan DD-metalloendopeptidase family protein [Arthrobacter sp. MP_2.3]|uniref:peptidoglycan DD-metalloendopeptidase family protein n=1 Tax=Arthrobacter sp. MP_2.3 TaxID=3349633 RepID=UPI0038D43329
MPVIGIAEVLVKPSFKGVQQSVGRELDGVADQAGARAGKSSGSKMGAALGGALKAGALAAGGAAIAGLGVALTKGFGRLQAIENAKAKLSGLGHDVESVTQIMTNAMAAVKGTAFGMDEAATVAAGAVAAGVKPGKDLERTLKLTGDAATIAGVGMDEMGAIFNKVATSNKIQGDVIAQLNDAGIPIVQLLGKEMGKTSEEVLAMSKAGEIGFDTFQKAMEKGLGGAALKSGETLQGAFKNTMASVSRIGANLLSGVYPMFTKFFQGLIKWMEPLEAKAKVAGVAIGVWMQSAADKLVGLHDVLIKGDFTGTFAKAFNVEEDSKLVDFLFSIREGAIATFTELKGGITAFGAAWRYNDGDITSSGFPGFMERAAFFTHQLVDAAGQLDFSSFQGFLASLNTAGGTAGGAFASMAQSLQTLAPAFQEFGRQLPNITGAVVKLAAVGLNALVGTLAFLADHVDTIIKFMPLIVAGFVAWRIASSALNEAQLAVRAGQVAMTPVTTVNNILRIIAVRGEQQLAIATGATTRAMLSNTVAQNGGIIARGRAIAGTVAQKVATVATTVATNAAALATRGLGLAIKFALGPVGLILAGITLAVGGLVWFFTQTELGKQIVANVWSFIQGAIAGVVDWFTGTALPAWDSAVKVIGGFFEWLWTGVIKPVFDGIGAAISWVYESIVKPVFNGIGTAVAAVGAAFNWLWVNAIKPVFDSASVIIGGFYLFFQGIFQLVVAVIQNIAVPLFMTFWNRMVEAFAGVGATIAAWWNFAVGIFNIAVGFVRDVLGTVFTWLQNTVGTVFTVIGALVSIWWTNLQANFTMVISFVRDVLGAVFTWLYESIVKPVFNGIAATIGWIWNSVIRPIFDTWVWVFQGVLAPAFMWLYENVVKPAFEGIGNSIKWVWDNVLKPVFDFLSNTIQNDIPKAFNTGVDAVKKAWDALQEVAKAPVRFVIDKVINEGLIGAFNTVAGFVDPSGGTVKKLDFVQKPAGFSRGGVLPGQSSWRNGDDQLVPMRRGEGVYVSEVMADPYERARLYAMNKAAVMGRKAAEARALFGEGFARGGIVNPLKSMAETQGYNRIHKGIDLAASVGTPVFASEGGRVSWSGPGVQAPGVWGGNEVHVNGDSGIQTWFAHLSSIAVKVGDMVRAGQQIALSGNTGITSGPHLHFGTFAGGWPNDVDPHGYLGGAGIPSGGGFNPLAGIIDGLLAQFKSAFPAAGIMADIAIGVGKKLFTSVSNLITGGNGSAAGDPALYDLGGILPPGISQVANHTRKPEAIYNNEQNRALQTLAARGVSGGMDAAALDRLTEAVRSARQITVQQMSSTQAQANALARALEGI